MPKNQQRKPVANPDAVTKSHFTMNTTYQTNITIPTERQRAAIIALLMAEKLPVDDLPASLNNFFVALEENKVVGAIGLEKYENCGLLRSMAVSPAFRNKGLASALVQQLESHAAALGIKCMYLLTETAPGFFEKKGYEKISRHELPGALQASSEFSHVCPVSATVMKKLLSVV
jgi:amino-acid N-acetyltransferase